ncbi:MAG: hypothetical protein R3Y11_00465 [Pseudomonadota bacterium]
MPTYESMTLKSGAQVNICALPYTTWEELEDYRVEALEEAVKYGDAGQTQYCNLCILRMNKELRRRKLTAVVENSEETLATLTALDVRELEMRIDKKNFAAVSIENLSEAGDTPATQTA